MTVRRAPRLRAATLGAARVLEAVMACMITCWRVCAGQVAAGRSCTVTKAVDVEKLAERMEGCERSDWRIKRSLPYRVFSH